MKHLFLFTALFYLLPGNATADSAWVEQAARPGANIASVGESRFDQLFRQHDGSYLIPYPFERLIDYLETRVDNGRDHAVRQVIIPLGRSLTREAAAPDYFRFPRSIIALQGEPLSPAGEAGEVMEYRLFIAHQPYSGQLEIISYNDAMGRFEFQLAENYQEGEKPRLRPANRTLCLSCHQNAGPIFPARPWSETNFNVAISNRLIEAQPHKYPSLIGLITLDADIIDVLSERANYLAAAQIIWKQGCATPQCRGALLRAILQYRLSGDASFDRDDRRYLRHYRGGLSVNWQRLWPEGLNLASSRIPDRDPLLPALPHRSLDPLTSRPPQAQWSAADDTLADGIVRRLAGFFTEADIVRIDHQLVSLSDREQPSRQRLLADCRRTAVHGDSLLFSCGDFSRRDGMRARLEMEIDAEGVSAPGFLHLGLPDDANIWQPQVVASRQYKAGIDMQLRDASGRLSQRLQSGKRISAARLDWQAGSNRPGQQAVLQLQLDDDFSFIDQAIQAMVLENINGLSDSLSAAAFRRQAIVSDLSRHLFMPALHWKAARQTTRPAEPAGTARLVGRQALLTAYCAHCHSEKAANPPGFLHAAATATNLIECAPRILQRLRAWQTGSDFPYSPMPPTASLGYSGISSSDWPNSEHYRLLLAEISKLVAAVLQVAHIAE